MRIPAVAASVTAGNTPSAELFVVERMEMVAVVAQR